MRINEIKKLAATEYPKAVDIFTEGFAEDPLHIKIFPEISERKRITRLIYEMMVLYYTRLKPAIEGGLQRE